ncbi:MAG: glycosyltransferase family 2 protein [Muribaculaceae bacterium]|nr:glycosyltransferase family 2 protein [Muribaculaceae bacterium]
MGIAVVIPVRNRAELVRPTLDSIANQTRRPDQLILVDNGSTDSTLETLREFAAGRADVLVLNEPRPGATEARNRGLEAVKQEYVLFFDSDDLMPRRHIEEVMTELERTGHPDIGAFGMIRRNLDGSTVSKPFRGGDLMYQHLFHCILSTQRYVVRTEFLRAAGGWPVAAPVWNDFILGVRLLGLNPQVAELKLSEPVEIIAQAESITGRNFSSKAGKWEQALESVARELKASGKESYLPIVDYRRAILAGEYRREGRKDLATPLTGSLKMRLIAFYVGLGGRGVAEIYRLFH